jgi:hypothetical protein
MNVSETYKKALELLQKRIQWDSYSFNNLVEIQHGDGSHFLFHNAFMEKANIGGIDFILVWTEHCGYHAFFLEDIERFCQYSYGDYET